MDDGRWTMDILNQKSKIKMQNDKSKFKNEKQTAKSAKGREK